MKIVTGDGRYWIEQTKESVKVGFTAEYLDKVGIIWNFVPREIKKFEAGKIFANVESSKCLGPLRSPVDGKLVTWNEQMLMNPDKITTDDFIMEICE